MKVFAALTLAGLMVWGQTGVPKRPAQKAAPAKTAQTASDPTAIREIRVEGVKFYTVEQVIASSGMKVGDAATKVNFEKARDRVLATGCFESFGWKYEPLEGGGMRATLQVTEPEQFLPWILDRVPVEPAAFSARAKQAYPLFADKLPPTDIMLQRAADVLQKMAAEKGLTEPMAGRVTLIGKDQIGIVFGPKVAPPNVAQVKFVGARVIDPHYLVKALSDVAVGMPYIETNFRMVLESQIRPIYEAAGRLRATFPKLTLEPWTGGRGVVVTVQVEEGSPYALENIEVRGTSLSPQELKDEGQFKTGETVNFSEIGKGMQRIIDHLKSTGYMNAKYNASRRLNDEKKTVEVFVDVDAGPQYKFGKLLIKGLDLETEPVIRKIWAMKPGEPFRHGYGDMFLNQVRERGVFDNLGETKAEEKADDQSLLVDIVLTFKGEKPKPERKRPDW